METTLIDANGELYTVPGQPACGSVRLFHSSGALVTLPVFAAPEDCYAGMFRSVNAALAAGFTVCAPGMEQGEEKDEIGWVVRTTKNSKTGVADLLFLYSVNEALTWKVLNVYLDTPEQVAAFEAVSGLTVAKLPKFPSEAAPQRVPGSASADFFVKVPKPFGVVYRENPKYNEAAAASAAAAKKPYSQAKKKFVRWFGQPQAAAGTPVNGTPAVAPSANGQPLAIGVNEQADLRNLLALAGISDDTLMGRANHAGQPLARLPQAEYARCKAWLTKLIEARRTPARAAG
jgi:hypothetical protein